MKHSKVLLVLVMVPICGQCGSEWYAFFLHCRLHLSVEVDVGSCGEKVTRGTESTAGFVCLLTLIIATDAFPLQTLMQQNMRK